MANSQNIQDAFQRYGIDGWSSGYFGISSRGTVQVHPFGHEDISLDITRILEHAAERRIQTPLILRFPQILDTQLTRLHSAFRTAMEEYKYAGDLRCVFPFKVNQRKEFIDALVKSGRKHAYGLEVGTKAELFAALSYELHPDALMVCNGFKDSHYIEMAFSAKRMGKNIILVIEGTDELKFIIEYAKQVGFCVDIGLRAKLYSKGSGLWEKSSGTESKFGLSSVEMMEALWLIEEAGLKNSLAMVHYHIGSQITEIKRVKNAMKEASRVFRKFTKMVSTFATSISAAGLVLTTTAQKRVFMPAQTTHSRNSQTMSFTLCRKFANQKIALRRRSSVRVDAPLLPTMLFL